MAFSHKGGVQRIQWRLGDLRIFRRWCLGCAQVTKARLGAGATCCKERQMVAGGAGCSKSHTSLSYVPESCHARRTKIGLAFILSA